jgi:hypothetical protein
MALSLVVGAASGAQPGNWAEPLFEKLDHDFGLVAKGAETKHRIKIVNKYPNPVHIAGAGTMCKCATARALTDTIAPGETGYVEVTLDTKKFEGNRDTTLIVSFDRPQFAEVRIPIKAFIRNDLEVTPGKLEFGSIARGSAAERRIHIALFRPGWTIREVVNRNKNLAVHFREIGRNPGGANYELVAALKASAPAGELREQLTLVTADPANPHVPILVEGRVEAEFSVSNELLDFGTLRPGMRQKVNLVVRGRRPFTIEKIESETTAGVFEVRLPKDARQIHVLELSVIAPTEAGTLREEFTISIPGCAEPVTFKAVCKVVPVTAAQP